MTVERVRVASVDGTDIALSVFPTDQPAAGLLIVHGLQSHAGWIEATRTAEHLAERGILSAAYDRRGSGRSAGARGHAERPADFLADLATAREHLRRELDRRNQGAPLHVLANCFGTRIVLPYLRERSTAFSSVILTSPATHMSRKGDYRPLEKLRILTAGATRRFDTPLKDADFVRSGPWLDWIRDDELSLRSCTASFLRAAGRLTQDMHRAVRELDLPLMVLTARDDVLVENDAIESTFRRRYRGPLTLHELPGDHYMDFTEARDEFRARLAVWLGDEWASS